MLVVSPGTSHANKKVLSQVPWLTEAGLLRTVFLVGSGSSGYGVVDPYPHLQVGEFTTCPRFANGDVAVRFEA